MAIAIPLPGQLGPGSHISLNGPRVSRTNSGSFDSFVSDVHLQIMAGWLINTAGWFRGLNYTSWVMYSHPRGAKATWLKPLAKCCWQSQNTFLQRIHAVIHIQTLGKSRFVLVALSIFHCIRWKNIHLGSDEHLCAIPLCLLVVWMVVLNHGRSIMVYTNPCQPQ